MIYLKYYDFFKISGQALNIWLSHLSMIEKCQLMNYVTLYYHFNLSFYYVIILNTQLFVKTGTTLRCKTPSKNVKFKIRFQLVNSFSSGKKFDCSNIPCF